MPNINKPIVFLGLGTAVFTTCAVLAGMSAPIAKKESAVDPVAVRLPANVLAASEVLKKELNRRFTDRQNIDFGMSRVVRPGTRVHYGVTMDRNPKIGANSDKAEKHKYRKVGNEDESLIDGVWVKDNDLKPKMRPENESEINAIKTLNESGADVALYTIGRFDYDKGEKPVATDPTSNPNANKNWVNFQYYVQDGMRAKGPAYISQKAKIAPRAYELVDFGRKAWASGKDDFSADGKDGWSYFAHRVSAPDDSCARCHGPQVTRGKYGETITPTKKMQASDPVGLFVIAIRMD